MDELRPFFGSTEVGWMLLKGAILAAAHGEGPYFVVSVRGEQGSAKSWTCRFPKRLLDPVGAAELDRLPRDEERWATTARNECGRRHCPASWVACWTCSSWAYVAGTRRRRQASIVWPMPSAGSLPAWETIRSSGCTGRTGRRQPSTGWRARRWPPC